MPGGSSDGRAGGTPFSAGWGSSGNRKGHGGDGVAAANGSGGVGGGPNDGVQGIGTPTRPTRGCGRRELRWQGRRHAVQCWMGGGSSNRKRTRWR